MQDRHVMMVASLAGLFCALLIIADLATSSTDTLLHRNREVPAELNNALGFPTSGFGLPQPAVKVAEPVAPIDAETTRVDELLQRMEAMHLLRAEVATPPPVVPVAGPKR